MGQRGPYLWAKSAKMVKIRKNAIYMPLIWGHSGTLHRDMRPQVVPMDHPNTLGFDFDEYIQTPYLAATYITRIMVGYGGNSPPQF